MKCGAVFLTDDFSPCVYQGLPAVQAGGGPLEHSQVWQDLGHVFTILEEDFKVCIDSWFGLVESGLRAREVVHC